MLISNPDRVFAFLSVYPEEKEVLYPPLTYLKPMKVKKQSIKGKWVIVAEVEHVYISHKPHTCTLLDTKTLFQFYESIKEQR